MSARWGDAATLLTSYWQLSTREEDIQSQEPGSAGSDHLLVCIELLL